MSQGSEWREVVLVCGSASGPWPTAHHTPQVLLFKLILNLIKNKPVEAGVSVGLVTLQLEDIQEVADLLKATEGDGVCVCGRSLPIITLTCKNKKQVIRNPGSSRAGAQWETELSLGRLQGVKGHSGSGKATFLLSP